MVTGSSVSVVNLANTYILTGQRYRCAFGLALDLGLNFSAIADRKYVC